MFPDTQSAAKDNLIIKCKLAGDYKSIDNPNSKYAWVAMINTVNNLSLFN